MGTPVFISIRNVQSDLAEMAGSEGETNYFKYVSGGSDEDFGETFIVFYMKEGHTARFERLNKRLSKKTSEPSPRNDGTTHHFTETHKFAIRHRGKGVEAKALEFTTGFQRYVLEHCSFAD